MNRPTEFEDNGFPFVPILIAQAGHNNLQLYDFSPCRLSFNTAWLLRQIVPTQIQELAHAGDDIFRVRGLLSYMLTVLM